MFCSRLAACARKIALFNPPCDFGGYCFARIDANYFFSHHPLDDGPQDRIMSASQNKSIGWRIEQAGEVLAGDHFGHCVISPSFFGQRDEERARLSYYLYISVNVSNGSLVGSACDCRFSSDDADASGASRFDCAARARPDHAYDGQIDSAAQEIGCQSRSRVAGYDYRFDLLGKYKGCVFEGVSLHGFYGARAVGDARGVAEIDEAFVREKSLKCAKYGQPADARIEYANGSVREVEVFRH
jgi:hypothetical protein